MFNSRRNFVFNFAKKTLLPVFSTNLVYLFFYSKFSKSSAKDANFDSEVNALLVVGTISEILSGKLILPKNISQVRIKPSGYFVEGDVNMWEYTLNAASRKEHDGGAVLQVPGFEGRLEALVGGQSIDPRQFGASANDPNCHISCQHALNYCAESGLIFEVPEIELKLSKPLNVPNGKFVSFRGKGNKSILHFSECHGIIFNNADNIDVAATTLVRDFRIIGNNCNNFSAIYFPGNSKDIERGSRCPCYEITGVEIHFFGIGIYVRFASRLRIHNNDLLGCYFGIIFAGQILQSSIRENRAIRGHSNDINSCSFFSNKKQLPTAYLVTGDTSFSSGYKRPESIFLEKNVAFKYQIGIEWVDCLFGKIFANDIDFPIQVAIRISNTDGGLTISENWIALDKGAKYGIFYVEMSSRLNGISRISNNYISGYYSLANKSAAIFINKNHAPVNISQNYIEANKFFQGIRVLGASSLFINQNIFGGDAIEKNILLTDCSNSTISHNIMPNPKKVIY